jgi:hypothetical protein
MNSLQQHHFSSNHPTGFFFKYYFYPCIVHFAYKKQILDNPGMSRTPRSVIILPSMRLNLIFPCPMILVVESSPRKTLPPPYLSYRTNAYGESYKRMHPIQATMPHDMHVCLKKSSTHPLLLPWRCFLL